MSAADRSADRLWSWFGVSSVVFLVVLAVSPFKDFFREYRPYQKEYRRILLDHASSRREVEEARVLAVGVRQLWVPELDNAVDRCVSCHLGVDDPRLASAGQPFREHPPTPHTPADLDRFGCVVCHRGQGRATTLDDAHGAGADWDRPLLPLRYTEASCGRCHAGDEVPEAALLSEGRALMQRAGCYACHALDGHEDWTNQAPDLDGLAQKTHIEWLLAWLRDPGSLRPSTWMPDFELSEDEVEALAAFLWSLPPKPDAVVGDEELESGDYDRGRKVFRESRCISCHLVDGKGNGSAPELMGVASRVGRGWLFAYLGDPHRFQPETEMPRYAFGRQELIDLTQYMMEELVDPAVPAPGGPYRPADKRIEAGEKLFGAYGCGSCHRILGRDLAAPIGPELNGIGDKPLGLLDFGERADLARSLPDWLAAKVTRPRSFRNGLRMPAFGLDERQVTALVTALLACERKPAPPDYAVEASTAEYRPPGRFGRLVERYRCQSCHRIQGAGGDISQASLTFEGSKVKRDWLEQYMLVPTTIRPLVTERMVPLRMPRDEAAFLADIMENVYVDDRIPGEIFPGGPPPERAERGRKLFYERYGCQACHMVDNRGGYYGPLLDGLGDRLESGWVAWWLQGPQRWRGDVRCPDYGLDETDSVDLAAFVASLTAEEDNAP